MKWYWYAARDNELFIDCDHYNEALPRLRARLQGAIEGGYMHIKKVYVYPSVTKNHAHIIVVLTENMMPYDRVIWEIMFYSDIYRACSNFMRWTHNVPAESVLIGNKQYHREPDYICECDGKHTRKVMQLCPASRNLRGPKHVDTYFGKPSKNPCEFLP